MKTLPWGLQFLSSLRAYRSPWRLGVGLLMLVLAGACSPTWNWREIRVDSHGWAALFPDKPVKMTRSISLDGMPVTMSMQGAEVEGATFTVAMVDLPDDAEATREHAVSALRRGMMQTVQGAEVSARAVNLPVSGLAWRVEVHGQVTLNGQVRPVVQHAGYTAYGRRAWQWVVVGPQPEPEVVNTFLDSFRLIVSAP